LRSAIPGDILSNDVKLLHTPETLRRHNKRKSERFPARHNQGGLSVKQTAGTLLYRQMMDGLEVLLVHPSGNYNSKAPWSIPKGEVEKGESLELAARRETIEETGIEPGALVPLGYIEYTKSRKQVHCFTGPVPPGAVPTCASWEIDCSEFVSIAKAKRVIHPDQVALLERLEAALGHHK